LKELHNAQYLGSIKLSDSIGVSAGVFGFIVIVAAVLMFWLGEKAEKRFQREEITKDI
jgi:hypothetical protein